MHSKCSVNALSFLAYLPWSTSFLLVFSPLVLSQISGQSDISMWLMWGHLTTHCGATLAPCIWKEAASAHVGGTGPWRRSHGFPTVFLDKAIRGASSELPSGTKETHSCPGVCLNDNLLFFVCFWMGKWGAMVEPMHLVSLSHRGQQMAMWKGEFPFIHLPFQVTAFLKDPL